MATNWSCLWEEWGRLEDKCFSSIASSWQSDTLSNGTSAQVSLSVVQHFLNIRNSWQHCLAMYSHIFFLLHVDITIYREILVIYAHVFQTPASDVNSHMELFQSWIDIVCFSLPTVIVSIKRAKHSRSSAVPRKVIFDWFQLRPGIVITLLVVWKNNKGGKIWRLDVK